MKHIDCQVNGYMIAGKVAVRCTIPTEVLAPDTKNCTVLKRCLTRTTILPPGHRIVSANEFVKLTGLTLETSAGKTVRPKAEKPRENRRDVLCLIKTN